MLLAAHAGLFLVALASAPLSPKNQSIGSTSPSHEHVVQKLSPSQQDALQTKTLVLYMLYRATPQRPSQLNQAITQIEQAAGLELRNSSASEWEPEPEEPVTALFSHFPLSPPDPKEAYHTFTETLSTTDVAQLSKLAMKYMPEMPKEVTNFFVQKPDFLHHDNHSMPMSSPTPSVSTPKFLKLPTLEIDRKFIVQQLVTKLDPLSTILHYLSQARKPVVTSLGLEHVARLMIAIKIKARGLAMIEQGADQTNVDHYREWAMKAFPMLMFNINLILLSALERDFWGLMMFGVSQTWVNSWQCSLKMTLATIDQRLLQNKRAVFHKHVMSAIVTPTDATMAQSWEDTSNLLDMYQKMVFFRNALDYRKQLFKGLYLIPTKVFCLWLKMRWMVAQNRQYVTSLWEAQMLHIGPTKGKKQEPEPEPPIEPEPEPEPAIEEPSPPPPPAPLPSPSPSPPSPPACTGVAEEEVFKALMYSVHQLGMEIEETLAKEIVHKSLRKLEDAAIGDANSGKAREIFCTAIATWTREDYEKARAECSTEDTSYGPVEETTEEEVKPKTSAPSPSPSSASGSADLERSSVDGGVHGHLSNTNSLLKKFMKMKTAQKHKHTHGSAVAFLETEQIYHTAQGLSSGEMNQPGVLQWWGLGGPASFFAMGYWCFYGAVYLGVDAHFFDPTTSGYGMQENTPLLSTPKKPKEAEHAKLVATSAANNALMAYLEYGLWPTNIMEHVCYSRMGYQVFVMDMFIGVYMQQALIKHVALTNDIGDETTAALRDISFRSWALRRFMWVLTSLHLNGKFYMASLLHKLHDVQKVVLTAIRESDLEKFQICDKFLWKSLYVQYAAWLHFTGQLEMYTIVMVMYVTWLDAVALELRINMFKANKLGMEANHYAADVTPGLESSAGEWDQS